MNISETGKRHTKQLLLEIAGVLTIVPLAPFICRFIPPVMLGDWNIDLVISVIVAIVIVRLLIWLLKPLIIGVFLLLTGILIYNQYNDFYSFSDVFNDYKSLVRQNWVVREQKQYDLLSSTPTIFENNRSRTSRLVQLKVQYKDSLVRNFSVKHSLENFGEYQNKYGMLVRYLSLFKYINENFKYVPDSKRDEYYATPRETILNGFGGDCDDHSILMASCLMSIGANCRLVIIEGHMYPELYVGDKDAFDKMQQAIVQLFGDKNIEKIFYHEHDGEYWINLDYTANHPGGPYLNDKVKLLIDL
jgi:transglutaminase-like putative cysteine protease